MIDNEVLFFFQAEDGIRDADVTGVQTCALPISPSASARCHGGARAAGRHKAGAWSQESGSTRSRRARDHFRSWLGMPGPARDQASSRRIPAGRMRGTASRLRRLSRNDFDAIGGNVGAMKATVIRNTEM